MGSRSRRSIGGMEVPLMSLNDCSPYLKWVSVEVEGEGEVGLGLGLGLGLGAPPTEDACSCQVFGERYVVWMIHKSQPNALNLIQLGFHSNVGWGLRIIFPDSLSPFCLVVLETMKVYALSVSGVAYLLNLQELNSYEPNSIIPSSHITQVQLPIPITCVSATPGCLAIGRPDSSVACFQLGLLPPSSPAFMYDLRDDATSFWNFMSRGRTVGPVQDLLISELHGKKLIYVLHLDGSLRVWDLSSHNKVFSYTISIPTLAGATFARLWVGEADHDTKKIPFAILCRQMKEVRLETISIFSLSYCLDDKINLSLDPSVKYIPLEEGGVVDVKLVSNKIWLLNEDGLIFHDLFGTGVNEEDVHCYGLQEAFVSDQLFQSPEHSSNLVLMTHSLFSSTKDRIVPFASSMYLRRLVHPGVHHSLALRATLQDYDKHLTDTEFLSLTVEGLKKEILSVIVREAVSENPVSAFYCWKSFCTRYFHYWRSYNVPYGLFVDSSTGGSVMLIRRNSISLFRNLEDIELLMDGYFDEIGGLNLGLDDVEREILFEVLRCINNVSQQLGKAASAIFYESSLVSGQYEEMVPCILKILETGYCSSVLALHTSDIALDKELADHKNLRKFSIDMLLSLHGLCSKATTWARVLNVIESYLKFLVPRKTTQKLNNSQLLLTNNTNTCLLVQATCQVARVMFESALDMLVFLSYLVNMSGHIGLSHEDISRIQLELVPMIQEVITEWLIIHFFSITPTESLEHDFTSQLSSLHIDGNYAKISWSDMLGKCDFTLAFVLLLDDQHSFGHHSLTSLANPQNVITSLRDFTSWIIWGSSGREESCAFFNHSAELVLTLLRHGQCDAVKYLLTIVDAHSRKEKVSQSIQTSDGVLWCTLQHLLGCCLLAQAHSRLHGLLKQTKVSEAIRCFFRASSSEGAIQALQSLPTKARSGLPNLCLTSATTAWKLHYYEWAMQIFEQYKLSEGACQFALAALEQVDEALRLQNTSAFDDEPPTTIKGRLWANVFKFTLDLNHYYDAYCAIISNPDEESKYICLRRFIIVLYEHGAMKILCDGQLPFIGLTEKVERELAWKAERSEVLAKPNPYKLLYAFEMHRHNWRKAATYIYRYSARLKLIGTLKDSHHRRLTLQERMNGLSAAINALNLVHPPNAWIDPPLDHSHHSPSKRARKTLDEQPYNDIEQSYVDVGKLENEFLLTSAEYLLSLENVKSSFTGGQKLPPDMVDLLVRTNLYDMAFTVLLKFWKGSDLKRELERVFVAMSLKCCPDIVGSTLTGNDLRTRGLLLSLSNDEIIPDSHDVGLSTQHSEGNSHWETLVLYLEKYRIFHARLPVIVAETLLSTDPHIELPLWLVNMFKVGGRENKWGMSGNESDAASLLRVYVDYGRYSEATNLVLEYLESFASVRAIQRKRPSAVWFPYTSIERLCFQLEAATATATTTHQSHNLKQLMHAALVKHLKLVKVDSDDALC